MSKQLTLTEREAYTVYASIDDMRSGEKGIYQTYTAANIKSAKAGSWGEDGQVREKMVWVDTEGNVYEVKPLGKFTDVTEAETKKMLDSIKSKLSQAELKYLQL